MFSPNTLDPSPLASPLIRRFRWLFLIVCVISGTTLVGYGSFGPRSRGVPIVDVQLGDNVVAQHPQEKFDQTFGEAIDPANWRQVDLHLFKKDGTEAKIQWLRPLPWFRETFGGENLAQIEEHAFVGRSLLIDMPEFGLVGEGEVTQVRPCPLIKAGSGSSVTGRFEHVSSDVFDLYVSGQKEPLGTTSTHPFWSETRQEFVAAGQLRVGENVRTLYGLRIIDRLQARIGRHKVYNLEVFGQHVYSVGSLGILVHNNNGGSPQPALPAGSNSPTPSLDDLSMLGGVAGKGNLTKAGHSLSKHAAGKRAGSSAFPDPRGNPAQINQIAKQLLDDILTDPKATVKQRPGRPGEQLLQIHRPNGSGAIYKWDGSAWVFSHFAENLF